MVELLVLSHSKDLANGVKELMAQMAPDVKITAIGGTREGDLGSDGEKIIEHMSMDYPDGLIVLFDLGSSMMNAEMAYEFLDEDKKEKVFIADQALVEGAVQVAVMAQGGDSFENIKAFCQENKYGKLV